MTKMFELAGVEPADASTDAERVLALETELARASMARVEQRKPENVYHMTPVSELRASAPALRLARALPRARSRGPGVA